MGVCYAARVSNSGIVENESTTDGCLTVGIGSSDDDVYSYEDVVSYIIIFIIVLLHRFFLLLLLLLFNITVVHYILYHAIRAAVV